MQQKAQQQQESLEMDETLEKILFYCLDEAKQKLEQDNECAPFTLVVNGDQMLIENYPDEDVQTCRANAEANIRTASSFGSHYAFCYDGFLETNQGALDAIIVECAQRDMEKAYVIGLLYEQKENKRIYKDQAAFIDYAPMLFDAAAVAYAEGKEEGQPEDELVAAAKEAAKKRQEKEAAEQKEQTEQEEQTE